MTRNNVNHLIRQALVAIPAAGLAAGGIAWFTDAASLAELIWGAATVPVAAALGVEIVVSLRRAEVGLDIVAMLAMVSALLLGETLAGVVVALMYAGGQFLESYAAGRARREMTALLERAPKSAMRYGPEGLVEVPIDSIATGDRILVRGGEVVPADGTVVDDRGARPVGADRRGDAGQPVDGRGGDERIDECRHGLRPRRDPAGDREHLCRHRPPGRGGRA